MGISRPYCTKCGKQLEQDEIIYPDLVKWSREYKEAKEKGLPLPACPGPAVSTCCNAFTIYPPSPEVLVPPLEPGTTRIETPYFSAILRLCNAIEKSPFSIKAYLPLHITKDLFGPSIYFIDVKAKRFKERIREIMPTITEPMIEKETKVIQGGENA